MSSVSLPLLRFSALSSLPSRAAVLGRLPATCRGWVCAQCSQSQSLLAGPGGRSYSYSTRAYRFVSPQTARLRFLRLASSSSRAHAHPNSNAHQRAPPRRSRAVLLTAGGGAAAAAVLAFTDDIKQSYEAAERIGRVAAALVVCINDYRTTLSQREKTDDGEKRAELLHACHKRCAERTLRVLEKCGGIFIKLGQHLSAMNYLLPVEWTSTFVPLQDQCPVSSFASIEQMYRADTGAELWEYFSEFAPEPIGAASLAQVHLATIRATGQRVAVKVQHPDLAQWAPLDLALTTFTFSTLKRFFPEYDLEWLSSEMAQSLPVELDFCAEARNARRTQAHFATLPQLPLVVPDVIWARERILVMACESGHRLDDLAYLDAHHIDRDAVSGALAHIFNEMIFADGVPLHCDPHGGNLAVRARPLPAPWSVSALVSRVASLLCWALPFVSPPASNFDIILYDHGLYRDIPLALRRSYAKMWLAVLGGDLDRMQKYAHEVAGVDAASFPLFVSAITGRDFSVIRSASILSPRTSLEKESMGGQLQEGLLADLVQLLGRVPRVILLILKTNDLTRSLDESLQTRQGPIHAFLIMAQYCLRTVLYEQLDAIRLDHGSLLWPANQVRALVACLDYLRGRCQLGLFDLWLRSRRSMGLSIDLGV